MLGKALRDSVLRSSALRATSVFPQFSMRAFASNTLNDKEKGDERVFFTKNDGKFTLQWLNSELILLIPILLSELQMIWITLTFNYREGIEGFNEENPKTDCYCRANQGWRGETKEEAHWTL